MYSDKISQAQDLLSKKQPSLAENRDVYEAILQFYSDGALIETSIADLEELMQHKEIKVYKTSAKSFEECVYNLLDENSELTSAKGMLRYYEASNFEWPECERAEISIGDALTQDTYGWKPDSWTVFNTDDPTDISLTIIAAI